jgi:hypothetical protein
MESRPLRITMRSTVHGVGTSWNAGVLSSLLSRDAALALSDFAEV